jgi:RNA polymerase sigma factor (sigma-70 family)
MMTDTLLVDPTRHTVFIVDDDKDIRDGLSLLLGRHGYRVALFASAEDFLDTLSLDWAGCAVLDIRMPGMSGLDLLKEMRERGCLLPPIFITGHADAATARAALKAEAIDYLEKPVDEAQFLAAIEAALRRDADQRAQSDRLESLESRLSRLTLRERQVMELISQGRNHREIAESLGISPRTVEVYKARMMEKLQMRNLSELIRLLVAHRG